MASRFTPFERMDRLMTEMISMREQLRHGMWWETPTLGVGESLATKAGIMPWHAPSADLNLRVDLTEEGYTVLADIPGFRMDELDLWFDDGVLTLSGIHDTDNGTTARHRRLHEQVIIEQVPIAGNVRADDITARYQNGVLEVKLPTETTPTDTGTRIAIDE